MIPGEIIPTSWRHRTERGLRQLSRSTSPTPATVRCRWARTIISSKPTRRCASTAHKARGMRLDIAAGTAVRFEPGQTREVTLVPLGGARKVFGFQQKIMGEL